MISSNNHPKWWQIYLTFPLLIALFVLDHRLETSTRGHEVVQIGIILLVYGLIYGWLKANSRAISRRDRQKYYGRLMVVQIPPAQLPEAKVEKRPILQLPNSGVKGALSNTFEMNFVDADSVPADKASQEMNKE